MFIEIPVFDSYVHEDERGVHPEVEFIFDLKLPEDFEPVNADGEVQEFKLYPVTQVRLILLYCFQLISKCRNFPQFENQCESTSI